MGAKFPLRKDGIRKLTPRLLLGSRHETSGHPEQLRATAPAQWLTLAKIEAENWYYNSTLHPSGLASISYHKVQRAFFNLVPGLFQEKKMVGI